MTIIGCKKKGNVMQIFINSEIQKSQIGLSLCFTMFFDNAERNFMYVIEEFFRCRIYMSILGIYTVKSVVCYAHQTSSTPLV